MYLSRKISAISLALLLNSLAGHSQVVAGYDRPITCRNPYPCGECAVFDNNGNDLRGFITTNKRELRSRGAVVNDYSNGTWGYMQVRTTSVPSVIHDDRRHIGELNYTQYIRATLALYEGKDNEKATWWARQCSLPTGPLVFIKTEEPVDMDLVRYSNVFRDLEKKKFTIVEYYDTSYNDRDYDNMLKNHIMVSGFAFKDADEYKPIIDFYNNFLSKFSYTEDPLLENKSFITLFNTSKNKYMGYFNVVNGKLSGKLDVIDLQYERDKDTLVAHTFKKLKGSVVYVFGDETYGMDKNIIAYGRKNNIKLKRWNTAAARKFNDDK
jgi:hypothetical protein